MDLAAPTRRSSRSPAWSALRYFSLYRVVLTGLLAVLVVSGNLPPPLGDSNRELFSVTVIAYLASAIAAVAAVETRLLPYRAQVYAHVALDVVAITLIMHASGGVRSGLGVLLVVAVAGVSLVSSGRVAILSAALATLAVLGETAYTASVRGLPASFTLAGMLGAALFATAVIGYALAERVRVSEALAARQALDIANLSQLNEHIVQRMRSGVMVLDPLGRIMLLNTAARHMLRVPDGATGRTLHEVAPRLAELFQGWQRSGENPAQTMILQTGNIEVMPSFTRLGGNAEVGAMVYLEDAAELRQRAQQLKLASLGRLTASIAHEIRNPLGAISHASQLLGESPALAGADRRLTQIIEQHTRRMNAIIENVLAIGRRDMVVSESFDLLPWLNEFVAELRERHNLPEDAIRLHGAAERIMVRIDRGQLHQIVWNLVENGLRYSRGNPLLVVECGIFPGSERPYLDVKDSGPGMTDEVAEHVFEPFFTSEPTGTGLGLYIARELAESNQAALSLVEHGPDGARFRLTFAHPDRRQVAA